MICMTCGINVPPEFKQSILKNVCPGCDGEIMNPEGKILLDELKDAMNKMPNDPDGLAGWLLSNYQLVKIGSAQPVQQFYGPRPVKNTAHESNEEIKIHPNATVNKFFERAGLLGVNQKSKPPVLTGPAMPGFNTKSEMANSNDDGVGEMDVNDMPKDMKSIASKLTQTLEALAADKYGSNEPEEYIEDEEDYADEEYIPESPNLLGPKPLVNNSLLLNDPKLPPLQNKDVKVLNNVFMNSEDAIFAEKERLKKLQKQNLLASEMTGKNSFKRE